MNKNYYEISSKGLGEINVIGYFLLLFSFIVLLFSPFPYNIFLFSNSFLFGTFLSFSKKTLTFDFENKKAIKFHVYLIFKFEKNKIDISRFNKVILKLNLHYDNNYYNQSNSNSNLSLKTFELYLLNKDEKFFIGDYTEIKEAQRILQLCVNKLSISYEDQYTDRIISSSIKRKNGIYR